MRKTVRNFGNALKFNGTSSFVRNTTNVPGADTALSMACWFKAVATNSASVQTILHAGAGTGGTRSSGVILQSGLLRGGYFNSVSYTAKNSDSYLVPNTWYHVVFTWDGVAANLYINGQAQSGTGNNPNVSDAGGFYVGEKSSGSNFFAGVVDEVRCWQRVLTAAEVTALYYQGTTPSANLYLAWNLDEGSGTTAIDTSGNGITGTSANATYVTDVPMKARNSA